MDYAFSPSGIKSFHEKSIYNILLSLVFPICNNVILKLWIFFPIQTVIDGVGKLIL